MIKKNNLINILILFLFVFSSCTESSISDKITPVTIFKGNFEKFVETKGITKPVTEVNIATPEGIWGTIEMMAPEGTIVKKGDLIAKINIREFIEAYSGQIEYYNSEKIAFERKKAELPLDLFKLNMDLNDKKNKLKSKELDLKLLNKGPSEDIVVKNETDLEVSSMKLEKHSFPKKKILYDKGYLSEQDLNSSNLDYSTIKNEKDKAEISIIQMQPKYNIYEIKKRNLEKDQADIDLKINQIENKARKSSLNVKTKNNEFKIRHFDQESKRIKEKIKMADLFSPIDGIVIYPKLWGWRKVNVGMEVWEGFTFLKISVIDKLKIEAGINELEIISVKTGLPVELRIDNFPDKVLNGKVSKISKLAKYQDESNPSGLKYFDVDIEIPENNITGDFKLKPNMSVNIKIISEQKKDSFYVPVDALIKEGDKNFVYFDEMGKPLKKQVKILERNKDFVSLSGKYTINDKFYIINVLEKSKN